MSLEPRWNDDQPIYRQLRDWIIALILEGALQEGEALPSVRSIAAEYRLNPLTVLKAYQHLAEEGLVESRRGVGMFVSAGAHRGLLAGERERFLKEEWPQVLDKMERLGFTAQELLTPRPRTVHNRKK